MLDCFIARRGRKRVANTQKAAKKRDFGFGDGGRGIRTYC